jgi:hypothetical protein
MVVKCRLRLGVVADASASSVYFSGFMGEAQLLLIGGQHLEPC